MPTYTCSYSSGLLDVAKKANVARAITEAHAEITGAPPHFVQVLFNEVSGSDVFIGGRKVEHDHIFVFGHIRAGRSKDDRKALIERLTADVAGEAGVEPFSVWVYIHELPPAAMVEFGHILPAPGEEAAWSADLPEADASRMRGIGKPLK